MEDKLDLKCETCEKQDESVITTRCPYNWDVNNMFVLIDVCEECLHQKRMDI